MLLLLSLIVSQHLECDSSADKRVSVATVGVVAADCSDVAMNCEL